MTPEPNDPNLFDEPMDTRLLQLERELFSLSPVAPPRGLTSRLDGRLSQPACVERRVVAQVVPFRWSRIVVPAAAAVVVVSVLSRMESPRATTASPVTVQPGTRPMTPSVEVSQVVLEKTTGYLMKEEPIVIHPDSWQALHQQFLMQAAQASHSPQPAMRRAALTVPLSFH